MDAKHDPDTCPVCDTNRYLAAADCLAVALAVTDPNAEAPGERLRQPGRVTRRRAGRRVSDRPAPIQTPFPGDEDESQGPELPGPDDDPTEDE